jgi:hypothetical protein
MMKLGNLMKEAAGLQEKLEKLQNEIAEIEVTGSSGGGMVKITLNGKGRAVSTKIDPSLLEDDAAIIEDLVVAALNDAKDRLDGAISERMQEVTGGMGLPPGFLGPGS